ncbi:GtrA family protein [Streptomyces sp. NPDC005813]|uniref:GtrA family protein n=1 Tax=Streptomyces sp. NPDC005813 TaxID=3155592 RepID=UPI0033DBE406
MSDLASLTLRMRDAIGGIWREAAAFGLVGALALLVDTGAYNLLVFGLPGVAGAPMRSTPVQASAIATGVAMIVSWAGNRYWTYRHRRHENVTRELALFVFVNIVGLVITAGTVALSRQLMGCECVLGDNAARLFGWAVATLFRFFTYRRVVFLAA